MMNWSEDDCSCPVPLAPWREQRRSRDCPVHGDVDERVDAIRERRAERAAEEW